jgi:hypothetical protein
MREVVLKYLLIVLLPLLTAYGAFAQQGQQPPAQKPAGQPANPAPGSRTPASAVPASPVPAAQSPAQPVTRTYGVDTTLPPNIPQPVYGPYDTILVPAKIYGDELLSSQSMEYTWVRRPMTQRMRQRLEEWTRLRNAVYVTYPYARRAGMIVNDINTKLALLGSESERKNYLSSREKELKKQFTAPLEQMSIYQGKILMKLINRQTGNNCYSIIRDYKGGFTARFYQTVAFFFSSDLKQPYDPKGDDQAIEVIVQEVERMYHG